MPENKIVSMETMVGWRANQYRGVLKLRHPMQNGIIEDWDAMLDVREFMNFGRNIFAQFIAKIFELW